MTNTDRRVLPIALLALASVPDARGQDRPVAYRGAAIETAAEAGRIESGVLVLRDGMIEAVGPLGEVEVPADALVVDADGQTIMPGIVEPAFPYDPAGGSQGGGTVRIVIGGRIITLGGSGPTRSPRFTRVADIFYPFDESLPPLLRSGLAYLGLVPSDYGQSAVVRITPERPESMIVEPDGRLFVELTNATASLDVVRKGLEKAKKAIEKEEDEDNPDADEGERRPGRGPGDPSASSDSGPAELWKEVVRGEAPLFAEAANAAAVLYLLEILEGYEDVNLVLLAAGQDVDRTLDRLSDRELTLLLEPGLDYKPNSRIEINVPRLVDEEGIGFAFTQGRRGPISRSVDVPLFPVGYLVATGLPRDVAIEALTIRPAIALGIDDRVGSLEEGKSASVLVFDGDPLDPYSRLRTVLIEGRTVYEN